MRVKKDAKVIFLPKYFLWFYEDLKVNNNLELMEFINKQILREGSTLKDRVEDVITDMKAKQNFDEYFLEYESFDWKFKIDFLPGSHISLSPSPVKREEEKNQ